MDYQSRESMLSQVLVEMQTTEPNEFQASTLASCDVLDRDADHTVGMWIIIPPPTFSPE